MKLDLLLAICKADCERCEEYTFLYIPRDNKYGLLCEVCMTKLGLSIDMVETKENLGSLYPIKEVSN